jgi:hypothetical protein
VLGGDRLALISIIIVIASIILIAIVIVLLVVTARHGLPGTAGDVAVVGLQCTLMFANGGDVHDAVVLIAVYSSNSSKSSS